MKMSKKKELKFDKILSVSELIMRRSGISSLNMDEVAKEAGIAKGTLYIYFRNKESIIGQLAFNARKKLLEFFIKESEVHESCTIKLESIIRANYKFLKKDKLYYDLVSFYEVSTRDTETDEMKELIREIIEFITSIIQLGQDREEIRNGFNPVVLAFSMWGMTVGLMQMIKTKSNEVSSHPELSEEVVLDNFVEIFISGIKK